jgi:hypothetical protein
MTSQNLLLAQINEKLNGSLTGSENLSSFVDLFYDGFEELKDGFQVSDLLSLITSSAKAFEAKELASVEAMDLQDDEITELLDRDQHFELGDVRNEARQVLKWILVSIQSYDVLVYEKRNV